MNSIKLGWYSLVIYLALAIISWALVDTLPYIISAIILSATSITSIILWYEAIRLGLKKSIKDGLIVSLFFIIPYSAILIRVYNALSSDELRDAFKQLIWLVFSHPMRIIPDEISYLESVNFFAFQPLGIIGLLILINLVFKKLSHDK